MLDTCRSFTAIGLLASLGLLSPPVLGEVDIVTAGVEPQLRISHSLSIDAVERSQEATSPTDLWERIRSGLQLADTSEELVQTHEAWFSARQNYLNRAVERSRLYLFHVVEEVDKRGMPMEIALLPMIESAYNPQAVSPQKASGIWQFIPSTGKVYGLRQNHWYDGRKDVLAATRAALDYLQNLHRMFGDWHLALAAYNCGEGCVARAVARNQANGLPTDYANLNLPTETRHYVPKLLAVRNIINDPERFGINLDHIANAPYFTQVALKRPMEARHVARLADMDLNDFLLLNPGFQRKIIHSDTPGVLLLPIDKAESFQVNLENSGGKGTLQSYEAKRGELLAKIAGKFDVTLAWLKEHNPIKLYRGKLAHSQTLVVPAQASTRLAQADSSKPAKASVKVTATQPNKRITTRTHTIRKGDTLSRLAKRYKVKVSDIRRQNQAMAEPLRPGDKIAIPVSRS